MKKCLIVLILTLNSFNGICQWQNLSRGLDNDGRVLAYDTIDNILYVGGNFVHADSIKVDQVARWNGTSWDSLGGGGLGGTPTYSMILYNGKLFASTLFSYSFPNNFNCLAFWDGISWQWDTINQKVDNIVHVFKEYSGDLYLGGGFTQIGLLNANHIAKYDGATFTSFPFPSDLGSRIDAIEFYNGQMYIGGNFYDSITGVNDLERWNGTSFEPFGTNGLSFGVASVNTMAVYNGELYIGGTFSIASGDPANYIMRWDGSQFRDVGGGTEVAVEEMHVFNDELYVCGHFLIAGSTPVNHLAKWNGSHWSEVCPMSMLPLDYASNINDFYIHNNDLFITGYFTSIDSVVVNSIAKYSGLNQEVSNELMGRINVYPNPANNILSISGIEKIDELQDVLIQDVLGRRIKLPISFFREEIQIDISSLNPQLYFIEINSGEGKVVEKFVKE